MLLQKNWLALTGRIVHWKKFPEIEKLINEGAGDLPHNFLPSIIQIPGTAKPLNGKQNLSNWQAKNH